MTNIGIIGRKNKQGELEFITAIADSQGTDMRSMSKNDTNLKIFAVGKNRNILLLGTGSGRVIVKTAEMLCNEESIESVQETTEAILHYTHQQYAESTKGKPESITKTGEFADFLVGGASKQGLTMLKVNTSGYRGNPKANKYQDRGVEPIKVALNNWGGMFDGSAWRHINSYLQGQQESGRPITIETISDALIESHDLSLRGARDIGANDKLHYGIVTPERTVRLIHPQTNFHNIKELTEYVKSLTGIDAEEALNGFDCISDPVKNSLAVDSWNRIGSLTSSFYFALASELSSSSSYKQEYTRLSEIFYRNPAFEERFKEIAAKRRESLEHVGEGVKAALSGDARKLRSYIENSIRRGNESRDELFKQFGLN